MDVLLGLLRNDSRIASVFRERAVNNLEQGATETTKNGLCG